MMEREFARYRGRVVAVWTYLVTPKTSRLIGLRGLYTVTPKTIDSVWSIR
jgi:hypothetical protein